jgi:folate-binding protein YgfZ
LLLTPQGKLDVAFRLLRVADDELWLDTDPGFGAHLAASLEKFRIRVKAEVLDRSDEMDVVSLIGPGAPATLDLGETASTIPTPHGIDVIGPRAVLAAVDDAPPVDAEVYDAWRIEQGISLQPLDIDEKTIPQEAELEVDAVSFTKGCFLGQELVARIDSRGHVNRYLRHVRPRDDGAVLEPGAEIVVDGRSVGTVTSAVPGLALGYVRHEVAPPAAATVTGAPVTVEALPGRR